MSRFLIGTCLVLAIATPAAAQEYASAREAKAAAATRLRTKNFAAAQAPLEAALRLTPATDIRARVEISRTLMSCYRLLPEPDKMIQTVEFILENSDSSSERSNVARDLASFLHQRGKVDATLARYEERLKQNAKDPAALAVLTVIHLQLPSGQKERGKLLEKQLQALDQERAAAKAQRLAKDADGDPTAAASNWKDVAKAWLEAGDKNQAQAAVDKSLKAVPETRTGILTKFWHEGLGDVLLDLGQRDQAVAQYEEALKFAPAGLQKPIEEKIAKAKNG
jgi:tetratricopeptide (TPR) repeat protein